MEDVLLGGIESEQLVPHELEACLPTDRSRVERVLARNCGLSRDVTGGVERRTLNGFSGVGICRIRAGLRLGNARASGRESRRDDGAARFPGRVRLALENRRQRRIGRSGCRIDGWRLVVVPDVEVSPDPRRGIGIRDRRAVERLCRHSQGVLSGKVRVRRFRHPAVHRPFGGVHIANLDEEVLVVRAGSHRAEIREGVAVRIEGWRACLPPVNQTVAVRILNRRAEDHRAEGHAVGQEAVTVHRDGCRVGARRQRQVGKRRVVPLGTIGTDVRIPRDQLRPEEHLLRKEPPPVTNDVGHLGRRRCQRRLEEPRDRLDHFREGALRVRAVHDDHC